VQFYPAAGRFGNTGEYLEPCTEPRGESVEPSVEVRVFLPAPLRPMPVLRLRRNVHHFAALHLEGDILEHPDGIVGRGNG